LYPINTHVRKLFLIKLNKRIQSPISIYEVWFTPVPHKSFSINLLSLFLFILSLSVCVCGFQFPTNKHMIVSLLTQIWSRNLISWLEIWRIELRSTMALNIYNFIDQFFKSRDQIVQLIDESRLQQV